MIMSTNNNGCVYEIGYTDGHTSSDAYAVLNYEFKFTLAYEYVKLQYNGVSCTQHINMISLYIYLV